MDPTLLAGRLRPEASLHEARSGILSVRPAAGEGARYDTRAAAYDRVVGSTLYNRLIWGTTPVRYRAFVRRALEEGTELFLDAGAGSAVFTAEAYVNATRPILLVDRSIGMLEAAQDRIEELNGGSVPGHVILLQADVNALSLRPGSVETILSMGMLHLFEDVAGHVEQLRRVLAPTGALFATSLVEGRGIGRWYLRFLHWAGEVARPRATAELRECLASALDGEVEMDREGNMAFAVVRPSEPSESSRPASRP